MLGSRGQRVSLPGVAIAGALMGNPKREPRRWEEVPLWLTTQRNGSRPWTWTASITRALPDRRRPGGGELGKLEDADLEFACVQAYNDWLIEEWAGVSPRFVPQCIAPIWPMERTVRKSSAPSQRP